MRIAAALLLFGSLTSPVLFAQTTPGAAAPATARPATPVCDGLSGIVRVSSVKPGMMDLFLKAVDAQRDWYHSHGLTDEQVYSLRITIQNEDTHAITFSDTEAMSVHMYGLKSQALRVPHDDAYKAFVTMFRDSSTIKTEYQVCAAKPM